MQVQRDYIVVKEKVVIHSLNEVVSVRYYMLSMKSGCCVD